MMDERRLALTAVALLVFGLPLPALAKNDPDLVQKETAVVVSGGTSWVTITWRGTADVEDFKLTAQPKAKGVEVSYPENTGSYTSLAQDSTLLADELDYTALRLTVPYSQTKAFTLKLDVSYVVDGKPKRQTYRIKVPVVRHTGADLEVVPEAVSVKAGSQAWVGVKMVGVAPSLTDVRAQVSGPFPVVYPADGSFTSLYSDATLSGGETDVARFEVDASDLAPGSYPFTWSVTYRKGTESGSVTADLVLTVTP